MTALSCPECNRYLGEVREGQRVRCPDCGKWQKVGRVVTYDAARG